MGDLDDVRVERLRVQPLQALGDLLVQALASEVARLVVEHVPDQRVREVEGVAFAPHQPVARAFLEQVQQLVLSHSAHGGQGPHQAVIAEEGCQREKSAGTLTEPARAGDDRIRHLLGQPQIGGGRDRHEIAALLLQSVLLQHVAQHFLNEQRIPLRRLADGRRQLVGWTRQTKSADQRLDLQLAEAGEGQRPTDVLALQARAQAGQALFPADRPVGADDEQRHRLAHGQVGDRQRQVVEEVQRQLVRPVQVVHDQQCRADLSQLHCRASYRQEEQQLVVVGLSGDGRPGRRRPRSRRRREPVDDLELGAERLPRRFGKLLQQGEQGLDEGQIGQREIFVATGEAHLHLKPQGN